MLRAASTDAVVSHSGDPMTLWSHVQHVALMPATCGSAWLLKMPILATMRIHRSLASLDPSHHDLLGPCACVSFVCKASVVVCVLFALLQCFATFFEICDCGCCDSSIEICLARQSIYSVLWGGCWGRGNHLNPGCSRVAFLAAAGRLTFVAGPGICQRRCGLGYMDRGGYYCAFNLSDSIMFQNLQLLRVMPLSIDRRESHNIVASVSRTHVPPSRSRGMRTANVACLGRSL